MAYAKKSVSLQLMFEVRRDAIEKSRNTDIGERTFWLIKEMCEVLYTARKIGILAIDPDVGNVYIPPEAPFSNDIKLALDYVVNSDEYLTELLTGRYWVKNLQGEDALIYYLLISAANKIPYLTPEELETLLLSCLPDEAAARYKEYKKSGCKSHTEKEFEQSE